MGEYWVVIPAAGSGERMGNATPKQYLPLAGSTVIQHALRAAAADSRVAGAVVVLAPGDSRWQDSNAPEDVQLQTLIGGSSRSHSVLNGLAWLDEHQSPETWVLVHDAARPCLSAKDLGALLDAAGDVAGAILGLPMTDTIKQVRAGRVVATANRESLYRAVTPQAFQLGPLLAAIKAAHARGESPTDECAAMEAAGHHPLMVEGSASNIKITRPEDWALAAAILGERKGTE